VACLSRVWISPTAATRSAARCAMPFLNRCACAGALPLRFFLRRMIMSMPELPRHLPSAAQRSITHIFESLLVERSKHLLYFCLCHVRAAADV
jgi:hypothetical protein